ncbi:MAG: hypothetical protein M3N49_04135 [Candidatus Eremiobacteraeota bacterium]|nr:hypothetical protein [Candidatus Eremiobacteraeota bacterium]
MSVQIACRVSLKLVVRTMALVAFVTVSQATAGAATLSEVNGWLASTNKVVRTPAPGGMHPDGQSEYVRVAGTDVSGWVVPGAVGHGFLANDQEVMIVPLVSGGSGGVFTTLLFTRSGGRVQFVGIIPSRNGHLDVSLSDGRLLVRTPVYKPSDPNCCPSAIHYERDTLRGTKLVKLGSYDARN